MHHVSACHHGTSSPQNWATSWPAIRWRVCVDGEVVLSAESRPMQWKSACQGGNGLRKFGSDSRVLPSGGDTVNGPSSVSSDRQRAVQQLDLDPSRVSGRSRQRIARLNRRDLPNQPLLSALTTALRWRRHRAKDGQDGRANLASETADAGIDESRGTHGQYNPPKHDSVAQFP